MCSKVAIVVSSFNRPESLEKTIVSILKSIENEPHDIELMIFDDGSEKNMDDILEVLNWAHKVPDNVTMFTEQEEKNMGLRGLLNRALDVTVRKRRSPFDYISYCQDDVAFKPGWLSECIKVWESKQKIHKIGFISCHDAPEHPVIGTMSIAGIPCLIKDTIRATHMFASAKRWYEHGVIPDLTPGIAAPKPGHGSMVDWWLVRDGPNSTIRRGEKCVILPGRCAHFGFNNSMWGCWNHETWFVKA